MLFNSPEFIFAFLPIVFAVYFLLNKVKQYFAAKIFLVVGSLFFYGYWNPIYLPLILISMAVNYNIGRFLASKSSDEEEDKVVKSRRKRILTIAIVMNLGLLGYFKYTNFFIENINHLFSSEISLLKLVLPLAISFFTFQQIAYLVDSYKGETKEYDFINYSVFVVFFPQLIAGPIVHHKEMMPQFEEDKTKSIDINNVVLGLLIFIIGLFKKIVLADTFAVWANDGFDKTQILSFLESWSTSLAYTFQLYFDFSGYTDMAIGIALLFNIKLPMNFNSPYKSLSIQEFWRRWHMTLSRFLRDYIYIPLGGNRGSSFGTYFNLMMTFVIGGIWHGAGWTFIFWGFLHGFALIVHRFWSKTGIKIWPVFAWLLTFNFVNVAWVFFRAKTWDDATKVLKGMISVDDIVVHTQIYNLLPQQLHSFVSHLGTIKNLADGTLMGFVEMSMLLVFGFIICLFFENLNEIKMKKELILNFLLFYFVIQTLFFSQAPSEFLYFRF